MNTVQQIVAPTEGTTLQVLQDSIRVLVTEDQTAGDYEMFEVTSVAESGPPPHTHPWNEAYFILEGTVEVLVGQQVIAATPGYFINIPGNTVHTFKTLSPQARFLVMTTKQGASAFFKDMDRELADHPMDVERMMGVAMRHRVMPVDPDCIG